MELSVWFLDRVNTRKNDIRTKKKVANDCRKQSSISFNWRAKWCGLTVSELL